MQSLCRSQRCGQGRCVDGQDAACWFRHAFQKCWMEHKGRQSKIEEDDPNSEAPLFYLNIKIQPSPENGGSSACAEAEKLAAPLSKKDEIHVGCEVELAGLMTNAELNGVRGRCLGKALTEGR